MKIANTIENAIIALVTVAATVLIINLTAIKPLEKQLAQQNALIKELAELEKYQIQNNFDKLKSHKGQITLDLENDMTVTNVEESVRDSVPEPEEKKGFLRKLFGND